MNDTLPFNPDEFLAGAATAGPLATTFEKIPVADYKATTKEFTRPRKFEAKDDKPAAVAVDLVWEIHDEPLRQRLGRQSLTVRQQFWLTLDADGKIASGKNENVRFGQFLDAVGANYGGNPFQASLGKTALIHVIYEKDRNDPTREYERVERVTKLV